MLHYNDDAGRKRTNLYRVLRGYKHIAVLKFQIYLSPYLEPPLSLALSLFMNELYFTNLDVQELHIFVFTQNYSAFTSSNSMKQYNIYEIKSNCMSN